MSGEGNDAAGGREPEDDGEPGRPEDPAGLLDEMMALRRRTRTARHAYWFPALVLLLAGAGAFAAQRRWGRAQA